MSRGGYRIGFDIGGTFTDFVLLGGGDGEVRLHKTPTSYPDPSVAALAGLAELLDDAGVALAEVDEIVHGTTLVTNAVVERKGARVALITTAGFADVIEAGTEQRYDIYDLFLKFPEPVVARDQRFELAERMDRDGNVVTALDAAAVRALLARLVADGVESVAVCLLNSFINPAHERLVGEIARAEFPELFISLSCEVIPEMWEYQRAVTTAVNAFVQPLVDRYLVNLERALRARGFTGELRLMHSAGGLMAPEVARQMPVRLLESGPAGGGLAAALFGKLVGKPDVFAFDMGGTTAKACLVENGRVDIASELEAARVHRFTKGSGLPIKTPVIDLIEIGAGGGSIAEMDSVGLLKVGPRSAGSAPGPVCYGFGGTEPTVTDANLVLGYYDPGYFLGGRMTLDAAAAEAAIAPLAAALGLSVQQAAQGIHQTVVENMASAARMHVVEKGKDPRGYAMIAFGGAGPAHAADVARSLGISEVIVPPASGAASALGFLSAPLSVEQVRSGHLAIDAKGQFAGANAILADLERLGRAQVAVAGLRDAEIRIERTADMRLVGQMHTVVVPLPDGRLGPDSVAAILAAFTATYAARYSTPPAGMGVEAVGFGVRCIGPAPDINPAAEQRGGSARSLKGERPAWFDGAFVSTPVHDRYALRPGDAIEGPAIIEEREATTVIPPGSALVVDDKFNLVIAVGEAISTDLGITVETPLAEAMARIEADPVNLEIMWSRTVTVAEEMWLTICRTAFSLVISEAQDFACDLLDVSGDTLAHSPRAMPVFNLTLPRAAKALIEAFPVATLKPGDVLVTNDPWLCAGHLFDIAVVTPIFRKGRVVALAGTVGNVCDIGGTRDWLKAREVYEEGFQIPPMKLVEAGVPNRALMTLLAKNVRMSEQVLGDMAAFVAANEIGAQRLLKLMDDYGMDDLQAFAAVVQGRSEGAMRDAIRAIPDGVYSSETWNNPFGTPMRFPVQITVSGDAIEVDFEGAPPQLPQGGINCTLSYTTGHATYPLKCMLTPQVRGNAGCYRPFTVRAPEGSILNARYPASVNLRTRTGWYVAPNIFKAMAPAVPTKVQAATGLPFTSNIYGKEADGSSYADVLFMGGGQGASAGADGKSGILWPTSAANTSIELFEARVPVLILEKSFIPDSGGAGAFRGGLAQRVRFRKLKDDGQAMLATLYPEGTTHPGAGLFGGSPSVAASAVIVNAEGEVLRDCGTGALVEITGTDEIVDVVVAGGAGYGDAGARSGDAIARDLQLGLVSEEGAARDYGARPADRPQARSVV
jgi:5-oxoprolinase (ATP-hydrolysing)/N-methylhydantoinase A